MGNGNCNHIVMRSTVVEVVGDELDARMEQIFRAASGTIYGATRELIQNYATHGVPLEYAAAAVGKAMIVNGVAAMAGSIGLVDRERVVAICDEVNALIADRLEQELEAEADVA